VIAPSNRGGGIIQLSVPPSAPRKAFAALGELIRTLLASTAHSPNIRSAQSRGIIEAGWVI
jgi:hypothetical protein